MEACATAGVAAGMSLDWTGAPWFWGAARATRRMAGSIIVPLLVSGAFVDRKIEV
jgi:hypothetical protein